MVFVVGYGGDVIEVAPPRRLLSSRRLSLLSTNPQSAPHRWLATTNTGTATGDAVCRFVIDVLANQNAQVFVTEEGNPREVDVILKPRDRNRLYSLIDSASTVSDFLSLATV